MSIEDIKTDDDGLGGQGQSNDVISFDDYKDLTITDDNRSVLTDAGVAGFDKDGNGLDAEGKVVLASGNYTKEDFETLGKDEFTKKYFDTADVAGTGGGDQPNAITAEGLVEGLELMIGNKDYKIDAEGNAVHADGTKVEKAEVLKMIADSNEGQITDDFMQSIAKVDGYDLQDDSGNAISFDPTPEGIAKRTEFIVENEVAKRTENVIGEFLNNNPALNSAHQYLRVNGSLEGFGNHVDYATVTLSKDDKPQQRELVISDMMGVGKSREEAEDYAKFIESNNKLFDTADLVLKNKQAQQVKDQETADVREQEQQVKNDEYFAEVQAKADSVVKDGKIKGYNLPLNFRVKGNDGAITTVPRAAFVDYLFKPVTKEGYTQAQVSRMEYNKSTDNLIFDDLLMFLGMDTNQLTLADKEDKRVKTIIRRKDDNANAHTIRLKPKVNPIDDIK